MRLIQLPLIMALMLAFFQSQAQKDSVWQTLKQSSTLTLKNTQTALSKYSAKTDSIVQIVQDIPIKYIKKVDQKIDKYSSRITKKTKKTLAKLSRWETKVKSILEQVSPETAAKLFAPKQMTFSSLLQKIRQGESVVEDYKAKYDEYRDKLTTGLKYIKTQKKNLDSKYVKPFDDATNKMDQLEKDVSNTEVVEKFIKERKKQLIDEAIKFIGKSKYLAKIDKEAYYYVETLRNYKEIFSDPVKIENTATSLLKKIPGFSEFMDSNSGLVSLFSNSGTSNNSTATTSTYTSQGYQSNAMISQSLQQRSLSGPSIQQITQTNASSLNSPLQELKNQFPGLSSTEELPNFKPNEMKSKTFKQRLQFGTNFQFGKSTDLIPNTADIGIQLAYKLNNKSSLGIGTGYKLGLGTGISNIKLSFEGLVLRSFIDWKFKRSYYLNGGIEYNYNASFNGQRDQPGSDRISLWKPGALIGISKKYSVGKMKGNIMVAYDFLAKQKMPKTQNIVFRFGYSF